MTYLGYGPSAPPAPVVRSGAMTAVKVVVAAALVCAGLGGAAVVGLIAYIVYSGCFLECSDANPVGGVLLGLLALGLLVGAPTLATVMWRTARTWQSVQIWAGIVLGVPALYVGMGLARSAVG